MTSNVHGSSRILGSLRSADGTGVVRLEDRYDTGVEDLWAALTDPRRLARWIGEVDGDLTLGGHFTAHFFATGWEGTGRVEACEPPHHWLVRTKDAEDADGPASAASGDSEASASEHAIEATLTADGDRTILVIEERGIALEQLAAYGAGNQVHLEDLAASLAGRERGDQQGRWAELLPSYESLAANLV